MNVTSVISVSLILFTVIDIIGTLPIIIDMKKKGTVIDALPATTAAAIIMISFLFFGPAFLGFLGIEIGSFAMAGSLILFLIGLEMILGIRFFRDKHEDGASGSIVPLAFPLLAGVGTLTTLLSLKIEHNSYNIIAGILINLFIIYIILNSTDWLGKKLPPAALNTLRKVFGIILIAIAIQMVRDNL